MKDPKPRVTATTHELPFDRLSPRDFERLCLWLVEREGYQRAEHLGAAGSEQGRDVVAWRGDVLWAFQCKRVRRFGPKAAEKEVEKVLALPEEDRPTGLVFIVTCDVRVKTRDHARELCREEMECQFWAGTELDEKVKQHRDILREFFICEWLAAGQSHRLRDDLEAVATIIKTLDNLFATQVRGYMDPAVFENETVLASHAKRTFEILTKRELLPDLEEVMGSIVQAKDDERVRRSAELVGTLRELSEALKQYREELGNDIITMVGVGAPGAWNLMTLYEKAQGCAEYRDVGWAQMGMRVLRNHNTALSDRIHRLVGEAKPLAEAVAM